MSSEWVERPLGEMIALQRGHDLPAGKRRPGQVPIMGSAGVTGYHDEATTSGPGVVIGRSGVGSMGVVSYIECDYWALNTALYVTDFRGNDVKFIYYLLSTINFRQFDTGSAQASLNRNLVYPYRVRVPSSLVEQKEIARTLSAIDDRIALLRETNATLEAIAQALFKSWFVTYDPVRAKQEGRTPDGMDEATAALFPDGFEESELGLVPRGWAARSLDSFADYLNGLALQKYPPEGDDEYLPVIKIAQLRAGSASGADRASSRLKPEYVVRDGDVLFSWSGTLEVELWCGGDGALNQHLFKVTSTEVPKWFYYLATRHFLPRFRDIAAHKATTMGHIQRKHLTEARLAIPPAHVLASLSELVAPLFERRVANSLQARYLASLRDTLLPRLISGQLRLIEAETEALAA